MEDERFATPGARAANASELIGLLDEAFATKTLDEWAAVFDADPDFFWAPVQSVDELLGDQQFHAAGGLVDVPSEDGSWTMLATPADFDVHPGTPRFRAPHLGEHTHEVLAELGKSEEEISALAASGVTGADGDEPAS
jgi:crotonobetainyl-CoA:carnitine CoA-transferase CaiB-like acyl-CoA transferase